MSHLVLMTKWDIFLFCLVFRKMFVYQSQFESLIDKQRFAVQRSQF